MCIRSNTHRIHFYYSSSITMVFWSSIHITSPLRNIMLSIQIYILLIITSFDPADLCGWDFLSKWKRNKGENRSAQATFCKPIKLIHCSWRAWTDNHLGFLSGIFLGLFGSLLLLLFLWLRLIILHFERNCLQPWYSHMSHAAMFTFTAQARWPTLSLPVQWRRSRWVESISRQNVTRITRLFLACLIEIC